MCLAGDGSIHLTSSDIDQLGHGMRFKFITDVDTTLGDHDFMVTCTLCLLRARSVSTIVFV